MKVLYHHTMVLLWRQPPYMECCCKCIEVVRGSKQRVVMWFGDWAQS